MRWFGDCDHDPPHRSRRRGGPHRYGRPRADRPAARGQVAGGEDALIRELHEELGIQVREACLAPFVFASHPYESFHLLMPLWLCRRWDGVVANRHHAALAWVRPNRLRDYPMPPADLPLVAHLCDLL